ncbi:MAG: YicC family protein [Deltaproteobacteria bacterium]|nr:YicC family protein [Deltaproteobacteria bacterium]
MEVEAPGGKNGVVKSMTGFGRGRSAVGGVEVVTEIRAVNHRFLDVSLRLPKTYSCFEAAVRRVVSDSVKRGKVDVSVTRTGGKGGLMDVVLDLDLAHSYHRCLEELRERLGLKGDITVADMLTLKEIVTPVENDERIETEWPILDSSIGNALNALDQMRMTEGAALWRDIEIMLLSIRKTVGDIAPLVQQVTSAAKEKLEKRVQELTGGMELDEYRLVQEVAIIADRSDVTEELTRLQSHIEQFLSCGKEGSPLGRKLDFLLQELHREVNTIGSKSASTEIAGKVVSMKAEVEKIREQTQNIE